MTHDEVRATKLHELSQSLSAINGALSGLDSLVEGQTLFALEAICLAIHRTAALVIELSQERHDCGACHAAYHEAVRLVGLPRPGDSSVVRPAKRRK